MLSLFPTLLAFQILGPFLLRITLGAILILWSFQSLKAGNTSLNTKLFAIGEALAGVLFIVGLWTQGAALVTAIFLLIALFKKVRSHSLFTSGVNYYFILFMISLSLLVMGAGAWGFDAPL